MPPNPRSKPGSYNPEQLRCLHALGNEQDPPLDHDDLTDRFGVDRGGLGGKSLKNISFQQANAAIVELGGEEIPWSK